MSQLGIDLINNMEERLIKWMDDTRMRFDAVQLNRNDCLQNIFLVLLENSICLALHIGLDEDTFLSVVLRTYREAAEHERRDKANSNV